MARLVSLSSRTDGLGLSIAGFLGLALFCATALHGQESMLQMTATTNAPAAAAPKPAVKPVASTTQPKVVPPVPDTFNRYGKIWAPSDDVEHPIKLSGQFPGVGDMKIPSLEELNQGDKLEQLAALSDADIHRQLDQWTPYSKMKLGDQGMLLQRIQTFKDQRTKVAMQKAHDMGLLTLTADQKVRFEKEFWDKQLGMERDLVKQFQPVFQARQQKMQDELFREFSSMSPAAQPPKPPPPANKPPQTAATATPIAQSPH
jgi:hypothetical protein